MPVQVPGGNGSNVCCRAPNCDDTAIHAKGLCVNHYNSLRNNRSKYDNELDAILHTERRRAGKPVKPPKPKPPVDETPPVPTPAPIPKPKPVRKEFKHLNVLREIRRVRSEVKVHRLERNVSPRFVSMAAKCLAAGMTPDFVLGQLTLGWSADEKRKVGRPLDEFNVADMESKPDSYYEQPISDERGKHKKYDLVKDLVWLDIPTLLVGSAGTGKTFCCRQVADELRAEGMFEDNPEDYFGSCSLNEDTIVADLLGGMELTETGGMKYQPADFIRIFRDGGLMLLDEVDACPSGVGICLNSALANGYISVPGLGMVHKHPQARIIAGANTLGKGADRQYTGRNQLDESTLDRFRMGVVSMGIDETLEDDMWEQAFAAA